VTVGTQIPLDRAAQPNLAPVEPLLKLREVPKPQPTPLQQQLKEIYDDKMRQEEKVWDEMYAVGQLVGLFIAGQQLVVKAPYSAGYRVLRVQNEDQYTQKAINLTQFYAWAGTAKILRSNPDIVARPGDDSDQALNASIGAKAIVDCYAPKLYDANFSIKEALLVQQYGTVIERLRYSPAAKGPTMMKKIMGQQEVQIGEGVGTCVDCQQTLPLGQFGDGMCPECGSTSIDAAPPPMAMINTVTGHEEVRLGDWVIDQMPFPACRWDLYRYPEESSWFIYRQRIPKGALNLILGDVDLPDGGGEDKGLDILHAQAYQGSTINGYAREGDNKGDWRKKTRHVEEMYLSPEDYAHVRIPKDTRTVSGQILPEGKMVDACPDGAVILGEGGCRTLLGIFKEKHSDCLSSSRWFTQGDSGAGRGMSDMIEAQRRFNASDGQIFSALAASSTPAWAYDPTIIKPAHMGYISKPRTNIPFSLAMLGPNGDITKAIRALEPGNVAGQYIDYSQKHLKNMMDVQALVLDFSDFLPIDNRTATGAQIASALANSLVGPQLQGKTGMRVKQAEQLTNQYRDRMPIKRWFPIGGKRGKRPGIYLSGADLKGQVVFEAVPDSELPVSPFIKQQDFTSWMQSVGGPQGYMILKQQDPEMLQRSLGIFHIKLDLETFDAITVRCRGRLDQLIEFAGKGITEPQLMVESMMPPISPFEAEHMQKMVWWQEWLDDDEASEPDMMPVRLAAELVIQTHFRFEGEQQVALAGGQGMAQAAMMAPSAMGQMAMQPEEPQEPAAEDHTAEELEAEAYENDQQRAFDADQAEIDREQEVKLKKMDIEGKVKVAKMKPKPKPAAKAKKK
jgi:hypothetical protein